MAVSKINKTSNRQSVVLYNSTYGKITLHYDNRLKIGWIAVEGTGNQPSTAQTINRDASAYCIPPELFVAQMNVIGATIEINTSGNVQLKIPANAGWVYGSVCFPIV